MAVTGHHTHKSKSLKHATLATAHYDLDTFYTSVHLCVRFSLMKAHHLLLRCEMALRNESHVWSSTILAAVLEVKCTVWGRRGQIRYVWVSDCGGGTFYNSLLNLILSSSSLSPPPSTYMPHYILKVNPINTKIMKQVELPRRLPLCEPARYFCLTASIWEDAVRPAAGALQLAALVFCWKWPLNHCFLLPKRNDAWWHKEKWEVERDDWGNPWEALSFQVCSLCL